MEPKLFVATKAFINYQGSILLLKESARYSDASHVGLYDVPGGRLKPGETWHDGLVREIKEETGLDIGKNKPFFVNEWRPVVRGENWQIIGIFFESIVNSNIVKLSTDHNDFIWINPKEYKKYPIIENLIPVFEEYLTYQK